MGPKTIKSDTRRPQEDQVSSGLKTQYFSEGSAIIMTERGILLVERTPKYEIKSPGHEPK